MMLVIVNKFVNSLVEANNCRYFIDLFKKIDKITGVYVEYEE